MSCSVRRAKSAQERTSTAMVPPSPTSEHDKPQAEGNREQVFQDTRSQTPNFDSNASSPVTRHSPSPSRSPFSLPSRDDSSSCSISAPSGTDSQSQDDGDQSNEDVPASSPTTAHPRQFQDAFLTLLSLLPANRYPTSSSSSALPSTVGTSSPNQVPGRGEREQRLSSGDGQGGTSECNGVCGELADNRTHRDIHRRGQSGYD